MTSFRLDASIRIDGSASREIADIITDEWLAAHPGDVIERRHIGVDVLPADAWPHAVSAMHVPASERSPEQQSAVALAAALLDELLVADGDRFLDAVESTVSRASKWPNTGTPVVRDDTDDVVGRKVATTDLVDGTYV